MAHNYGRSAASSCHLVAARVPGSNKRQRYVLKLLFSEKNTNMPITQKPLAREKISTELASLEF